jgi:antitoxin ParD1/3/4
MNKPSKPEADDVDDLDPIGDGLGPIPTEAEMDAWYERNREVIGELVAEALAETEPPTPWNFEEMLADAKAEFEKNQKG